MQSVFKYIALSGYFLGVIMCTIAFWVLRKWQKNIRK